MNNLIKINKQEINQEVIDTVSARELHEFLGSKQDFSTWIKNRIEKYEFVENQDYIRFHKKMEANNATMVEYYISLDMAKELSMIENNEKGREARKYFIQCERRATLPQTKIEAVRAYLEELEAHEATRVALTHKKEVAKLENGKSIYGASIRQVSLKTGRNYSAKKLARWCKANCRPPLVIHPNGYSSAKVSVYHAEAWREVYDIDLFLYFEEDELHWSAERKSADEHY